MEQTDGGEKPGEGGKCFLYQHVSSMDFKRNVRLHPNRASIWLFLIEPVHCQERTDLLGFFGHSIPLCCSDYAATIFAQRV